MALLSTILDRVHDELATVPERVAERALADSTKEFCHRTHAWQQALPAVRTKADRTEFTLAPDDGVMVVALKEVRGPDGNRVPPYAGELTRLLTTPLSSGSTILGFVQRTPSTIELVNAPNAVQLLSVVAALAPVQGRIGADVPDDLLNEYAEAIGAGAKMRLVKQKNTPWFAPEDTGMYGAVFYGAVNEARRRVATSMGEADLRIEMRSW